MRAAQCARHGQTIHAARHHDVAEHGVKERLSRYLAKRLRGVAGAGHVCAVRRQQRGGHVAQRVVVIDQQHACADDRCGCRGPDCGAVVCSSICHLALGKQRRQQQ